MESCHHRLPLGWNPGAVGQAELEIERLNQVPEVESLVSTYLIKSMVIKWIYLSFPSLCRVCFFGATGAYGHDGKIHQTSPNQNSKTSPGVLAGIQVLKTW